MKKQEGKTVEMTEEQMNDAIQKDLHVARTLLAVVLEDPEILKRVTDAIRDGFRRMQKYHEDLQKVNGREPEFKSK